MEKDYLNKFKRHYNIDFDSEKYEIHHIDLDHNNNDIKNQELGDCKIHSTINSPHTCFLTNLNNFVSVYLECNKWYDYKLFLDGEIPNIHGLGVN